MNKKKFFLSPRIGRIRGSILLLFSLSGILFAQEKEVSSREMPVQFDETADSLIDNTSSNSPSGQKKQLRDPFWPVGYSPEFWEEVTVVKDTSSIDEQWVEASKKIKVSFTKVIDGQRIAFLGREKKEPGDTIEITHNGKTFLWELRTIYRNGKLGLKKKRYY